MINRELLVCSAHIKSLQNPAVAHSPIRIGIHSSIHLLHRSSLAPEASAPAAQSKSLLRHNGSTPTKRQAGSQQQHASLKQLQRSINSDQLQQHQFVQLQFHFYQANMHDMADSSSHMPASICSKAAYVVHLRLNQATIHIITQLIVVLQPQLTAQQLCLLH